MSERSPAVPAHVVLEHLDAVLDSPSFTSSSRCQEFLRYVVVEAVEGRGDSIKERSIAQDVFRKGTAFEPSECSLVRVRAAEVRKRLTDYYESHPDSELRIELPVGSYIPRIQVHAPQTAPAAQPDVAAAPAQKRWSRRKFGLIVGGSVAALGITSFEAAHWWQHRPLDLLWRPIFATKVPLLIYGPLINVCSDGATEWTGVGPAVAIAQAVQFLTKNRYPYDLRFGQDLTFSQLREHPSLILGGYDGAWTLWATHGLRFSPLPDANKPRGFVDRQTKQVWQSEKGPGDKNVTVDYGLLCRIFDAASGQIVMVAAGTRTFGTQGAAQGLFDPEWFSALVQHAPPNWETMNFQALVRVSVIGITPSTPQLVTTHFW